MKSDDTSYPELGTAVFEFHELCDKKVKALVATGA